MIRILSLGAGVQSSTLLLMSCRGELPKLDWAIFADVGWESKPVYDHIGFLELEAAIAGIRVQRVSRGNLRTTALELARNEQRRGGERYASIPLHILMPDGTKTINRRQCTHGYKIMPIEQFIRRDVLGLESGQRVPAGVQVDHWFGITWDERQRVRTCEDRWRRFVYPFCGIPGPVSSSWQHPDGRPRLWTRSDCVRWLERNYPGIRVPRSACVACPYRSNEEWRAIQDDPESWEDAVEFDRAIRQAAIAPDPDRLDLRGQPFVHRSCVPLEMVDLRTDTERGQGLLWDGVGENECAGMCGV